MGALNFFNPRKYRLYAMDAAAAGLGGVPEVDLPPGEGLQSAMNAGPPPFDPGDIDVTMGSTPTPGKGPSRVRPIVAGLARHLQAGVDAAATPNIAGGGGADIMRGLAYSRDRQVARDMAAEDLMRQRMMDEEQRRLRASQEAENRAQAEWYRRRAEEQMAPKPAAPGKIWQDKEGNVWEGDKVIRPASPGPRIEVMIGPDGKPQFRQTATPVAMSPDAAAAVFGAGTNRINAERPVRDTMYTGSTPQGQQVVTVVKRGPNGELLTERVETGALTRAPRQTSAGGGGRAPSHTDAANAFVDRVMRDAQPRGISLEYAVLAAENPKNYVDVAPSVRMEAVTRLRRQLMASAKAPQSANTGVQPQAKLKQGGSGQVTVSAAGMGGGASGQRVQGVPADMLAKMSTGQRVQGPDGSVWQKQANGMAVRVQ